MTAPRPDLRRPGGVLLLACYELGQQPLRIAMPAAVLRGAGYAPRQLDLSREPLDADAVRAAGLIALATPMHTALSLGRRFAGQVRALNPRAHITFFGDYAAMHRELLLGELADSVIGGEPEAPLRALAAALAAGEPPAAPGLSLPGQPAAPNLARPQAALPAREALPALDGYAHLDDGGTHRVVGAVESTRGCKHLCRHCPIPSVYGGRFFALPKDHVLADIDQLVEAGAEHITFADPDFLNGATHALRIVEALHAAHPGLTYDFTAKVEHLLNHRALLPTFAATGCRFIVSAVESLNDDVLAILDKRHTRADAEAALALCREAGIALRPTFIPFTPWSGPADYRELLAFLAAEGLTGHVEPVQLTLRLLVPRGSLLAENAEFRPFRGDFDPEALTYAWRHPDPRMDDLHARVSEIARDAAEREEAAAVAFGRMAEAAWVLQGEAPPPWVAHPVPTPPPPRLTEPWFC